MDPSFVRVPGCLALIMIATALPALAAKDVPYVGIWSEELRNCGAAPASPESPMLIAKRRYDQYLTHCEFKSIEEKAGGFNISADCTVNEAKLTQQFTLTVSGDTLTFTDETSARDLQRCK